ncbi:MAG: hypothetical protein JST09_01920 [Bacteroidetes bacterium]|nr:hypothetical protein [Bacteroidota bacterium]
MVPAVIFSYLLLILYTYSKEIMPGTAGIILFSETTNEPGCTNDRTTLLSSIAGRAYE